MKISEKIKMNNKGILENGPINIVILGDSVSHGSVEIDVMDYESVYWNRLRKKINEIREYIPVNIINSAISGTTAKQSIPRLERDVISHHPDLVIVCYGLNDVNEDIEIYEDSLNEIFTKFKKANLDVIFLTPNMLNTYVAEDTLEPYKEYAAETAKMQLEGRMDTFMDKAREVCNKYDIKVCDCYKKWKEMYESGEDITMLLGNRINHPTREMHALFSDMLFETIFEDSVNDKVEENTMYKK